MPTKSTIVPKLAQNTLQLAMGGLERVNPGWSSRIAQRLWLQVGKPPAAAVRNRHQVPPGTPFAIALHGAPVCGIRWGDTSAPLAYLVHGWGGWWQQLSSFVPVLLDLGYQVVAFDALAHGGSGPGELGRRDSSVPEMAQAYQVVAERFGAPVATVAHSMGCLSVTWAQRYHGLVPQRQVLIAPAASTQGMLDFFARSLGLGPRTMDGFADRLRGRIGRPLSDFDLLPLVAAEQIDGQLPDALIVHDRGDRWTSSVESEALAAQWPNSHLLITEGHGHYRVLRAVETLAAVRDFLTIR